MTPLATHLSKGGVGVDPTGITSSLTYRDKYQRGQHGDEGSSWDGSAIFAYPCADFFQLSCEHRLNLESNNGSLAGSKLPSAKILEINQAGPKTPFVLNSRNRGLTPRKFAGEQSIAAIKNFAAK